MILHTIDAPTGKSSIFVGEKLENIVKHINDSKKLIVITDEKVADLYEKQFPTKDIIKIGMGESIKNEQTISSIYEKLLNLGADRSTFIIGVGGGLVCDIAGFVASTFMRGVDFAFVPTTLLAQVDASMGGKNGINYKDYKNIIGVFKQPRFVISDFSVLKSLEPKEFACGIAEVIKHGMIADKALIEFLENNSDKILSQDHRTIERIVNDSVRIKSSVVNSDETEKGLRRILNFGHTIGHAIEKTKKLSHGECVALGMMFSVRFSCSMRLASENVINRLENLLKLYKLPTELKVNKNDIIDAVKKDKKKDVKDIHFVLVEDIGKSIVKKIEIKILEEAINDLCCNI